MVAQRSTTLSWSQRISIVIVAGILLVGSNAALHASVKTDFSENGAEAKYAPGEQVPLEVKLLNFGQGKRVDVQLYSEVCSTDGEMVFKQHETVAVETTAEFIKKIQLPQDIRPGTYIAKSNIEYDGQEYPASSSFMFEVEQKIGGYFISEIVKAVLVLVVSVVLAIFGTQALLRRQRRRGIYGRYRGDQNKKGAARRELIHVIIHEMRRHLGDETIEIVGRINGLEVDWRSYEVIEAKGSTTRIANKLITAYEREMKKRLNK